MPILGSRASMPKQNSPVYGESLKNVVFVVFHAMIFFEESEKFCKFIFFCVWDLRVSSNCIRAGGRKKTPLDITPRVAKKWL